MTQALESGRHALDRHSWEEAYQELRAAGADGGLDPEDLERLADAAWWTGRADEAVDALERAYRGFVDQGAKSSAAGIALRLWERAQRSLELTAAQGWLTRAERLLEGEPESSVHAWYEFVRAAEAFFDLRDYEQAIVHAERAIELGRAHGDRDVMSLGLVFKGTALTKLGRIDEGLALIDEAATAATSGELGAKTACDVYCVAIATCRDVSDLRRAQEWTDRAERYMQLQSAQGYPGACKVHRAELKRMHGHFVEAEEEARAACDELQRHRLLDLLGFAYNEIGEVRLRVGDLDGAEEAFFKAYQYGWDPQPGLALLNLTKGDVAEAARSLARSLHMSEGDPLNRVQRLPAKVEVDLAAGDFEAAHAAAEELEQIAADNESPIWNAAAATARGRLDFAEEKIEAAVAQLDAAWRQWRDVDFPYESAKARTTLGLARRAAGDEKGARLELNAARSVFDELGAVRDVAMVEGLIDQRSAGAAPSAVTKTFMFTDIVTSTDLIGLIGDVAWASLLQWHDRTLEARFAAYGGDVVNHTGDGFFVAFDDARRAVDCAVDIQRTLHSHRVEHGFAPSIRIGIHTAGATSSQGSYTGKGVHLAARVGNLGEGGEIVVSTESLDGIGEGAYRLSEPRTVTLKGIPDPVEVRNVEWE